MKQQLAAVRMLFDWLITGQVMPHNLVLLDSIPTETVRDLRDRALIATLTYCADLRKFLAKEGRFRRRAAPSGRLQSVDTVPPKKISPDRAANL